MGTGAYMTVINHTNATVSCNVSNVLCMYENGDDQSHLEFFNASVAGNGGAISNVYIEANGSVFDGCAYAQSQFTLNFARTGAITLNLGSGAYNTSVVNNTAPDQIHARIGQRGSQYTIRIELAPVPVVVSLVNSWLWANVPSIEKQLQLPPVDFGSVSFGVGTLLGLETLRCTDGAFDGTNGLLTLNADQLLTRCSVSFEGATVQGGLNLQRPGLSASATLQPNAAGVAITVTGVTLVSGTVDLNAGGLNIPSFVLSGLLGFVKSQVNTTLQPLILQLINERLP